MHVAQVEHGLGAVLLFRRQPVVDDRGLVVHVGAVAVEVVVAQLDSGHHVTCGVKRAAGYRGNAAHLKMEAAWCIEGQR